MNATDRIEWNEYFIDIAVLVSSRSTCLRKQHGAVIVKDKQILSTGYNGVPSKIGHCTSCYRMDNNIPSGTMYETCRSIHAEMNSIVLAAKHGISINGADMYITGIPCIMCARAIINAGIKNIITIIDAEYTASYGEASLELLKEAGVHWRGI
jgi:dCMP deaminase